MMRPPHYLCIGMQKAGTTWLSDRLKQHPGIYPPALKEPHYFDGLHYWPKLHQDAGSPIAHQTLVTNMLSSVLDNLSYSLDNMKTALDERSDNAYRILEWAQKLVALREAPASPEWYEKIFAGAPEGALCGDFSADTYMLDRSGIDKVLEWNPDAKIILMLRDPVDRDWSQIRMMYEPGGIPLEDWLEQPVLEGRQEYEQILTRWEAAFGSRMHIEFYDHIRSEPDALLDRIVEFLELPPLGRAWEGAGSVNFKGPSVELPDKLRRRLVKRNLPALRYLAARFPTCEAWLQRHR